MKESIGFAEYKTSGWEAHFILIICSLLYLVNFMDRQVMAAVLQPMKMELGLSDTQAGSLQTVFLLSVAFFSVPVSYLVDRWSRRKAIALMAIFWSVFTCFTGLGRTFLSVILPRILVGLGESGFSAGGTAMITAVYSSKSRGKVMGIFNLVIPVGASLGVMLGGYISVNYSSWRYPFYYFSIPGIVLGCFSLFMKDYKTVEHVDEGGKKKGLFSSMISLFRIPTLKYLYLGYGIRNIMILSVLAWLSAYLMRDQGIAEDRAGMLSGVVFLMAIFGSIIGGILSDVWQQKNPRARMLLPVIGDVLASIALIIALLLNVKGVGFLLMCVYGSLVMIGLPPLTAVTQDVVPPAIKGISYGMTVFSMYLLGGGWGPLLVGGISDFLGGGATGLQRALLIMACSGFFAAFIEWLGSRHYLADMEKVKGFILEAEK